MLGVRVDVDDGDGAIGRVKVNIVDTSALDNVVVVGRVEGEVVIVEVGLADGDNATATIAKGVRGGRGLRRVDMVANGLIGLVIIGGIGGRGGGGRGGGGGGGGARRIDSR